MGIELQGKSFAEKELAGEALLAACKSYTGAENVQIGSYRGFHIKLDYDHFRMPFWQFCTVSSATQSRWEPMSAAISHVWTMH